MPTRGRLKHVRRARTTADPSLPVFPPEADFSDLGAVADALAAIAPGAEPIRPLAVLGSGYYSLAVETGSGVVFRLGCTADVTQRHEKEARLLPWLAPRLPLAVPEPKWHIRSCEVFPYGAIGYCKLDGLVLTRNVFDGLDQGRLADDLARFMLVLHTVPLSEALEQGADPLSVRGPSLESLRANVLPILKARLSPDCYACIAGWWQSFLEDPLMEDFAPGLVHYDVGAQHLLVDENGRLVGVLDWEHCAAGDPAHDFRQLRALGIEFQETVLSAYHALGGLLTGDYRYRLQRYWQHSFWSIQMAARRNDEELLRHYMERMSRRFDCCQPERA